MKEKRQQFVITIVGTVEQGVKTRELQYFVEEAVETWGGQFHPDDPLFSSMDVERILIHRTGRIWREEK